MNWNTCGGYMKAKNEKLDNIHNKNVDNNYLQKTEIFKNVAIYVTGYTVPSYNEIRKIIIENGGKFIHNYSKSKVTFIIATNVYGGNNSTHFPKDCIVRPKWIIDSLNQKKCLPVHEYTLFKQETIQQIPNTHENSETDEEILHILPDSIVKNDISSFYQHSRLHVMSTLLVDLKIFVSNYHKYFDVSLCQNLKKFLFEFENNQDEFDTIENQPTLLNTYLYLDMDCFFASVSLIGKDHWQCQPVVVSHGRDQNSMSEISSCNYVARKLGIRNGMLLKIAFKKCPHLVILPYEFHLYRKYSFIVYDILLSFSQKAEAISCDELVLDISSFPELYQSFSPIQLGHYIRSLIKRKTHCDASIGISHSILAARICAKYAKPNNCIYMDDEKFKNFIFSQKLSIIPHINKNIVNALSEFSLYTCGDISSKSIIELCEMLKISNTNKSLNYLIKSSKGMCDKLIKSCYDPKSISVCINYAVRLSNTSDLEKITYDIANQVLSRLKKISKQFKSINISLKIRHPDAPIEPQKYMGCGHCNTVYKKMVLINFTSDLSILHKKSFDMINQLTTQIGDIRGITLCVSDFKNHKTKKSNDIITMLKNAKPRPKYDNDSLPNCHVIDKRNQQYQFVTLLSAPKPKIRKRKIKLHPNQMKIDDCFKANQKYEEKDLAELKITPTTPFINFDVDFWLNQEFNKFLNLFQKRLTICTKSDLFMIYNFTIFILQEMKLMSPSYTENKQEILKIVQLYTEKHDCWFYFPNI